MGQWVGLKPLWAVAVVSLAIAAPVIGSPMIEADKLYDAGELKGAETAYRAVLQAEPDNVFALEGLESSIRFQPGRGSQDVSAIHTRLQNLQAKPPARSRNDELGDAYFRSHDYKNAEPLYRDALAADPSDLYARLRLIDCLDGQNKTAEAAAVLQAAKAGKAASPTAPPAPAEPQTAITPAAPAALPAGMTGWYAMTQIGAGGNLTATFFNIGGGGQIYRGLPNSAKSFDELRQMDAKGVGTYQKDDTGATFQFPGEAAQHHTLGGGMIDSSPLQKVTPLQAGNTFNGKYAIAHSASFGGVDSYGADIWTFAADGSYQHEGVGSVYTTAHHAGTGEHPAQSNGAGSQTQAGKYSFSNGVMTLSGDGSAHAIWNIGERTPPWYLLIDGKVYTGQ